MSKEEMKMKNHCKTLLLLSLSALLPLVSCQGKTAVSSPLSSSSLAASSSSSEETGITLPTYKINLNIGDEYTLTPTLHGLSGSVSYLSKNTAICTVDDKGLISALSLGTTLVKVFLGDWSALCQVNVVNQSNDGAATLSLSLSESALTLYQNESYALTPTLSKAGNVLEGTFTYSSSDATLLSVSASGVLSPIKVGNATITVIGNYGKESAFALCEVTIVEAQLSLVEAYADRQVVVGTPLSLIYRLQKGETSTPVAAGSITYASSDTSIGKPRAGKLYGIQKGNITLTATAIVDGTTYVCATAFRIRENYTVNYVIDGVNVHSENVMDGDKPTYQEIPTSAGHVFKRWNVGTGAFAGVVESDLTLTAAWYAYSADTSGIESPIYSYSSKEDITPSGGAYCAYQSSDSFAWSTIQVFTTSIDGAFGILLPALNYSAYPAVSFRIAIDFYFTTLSYQSTAFSTSHWSANEVHLITIKSSSLYCDGKLITTIASSTNSGTEGLLLTATNDSGSGRLYFSDLFGYLVDA